MQLQRFVFGAVALGLAIRCATLLPVFPIGEIPSTPDAGNTRSQTVSTFAIDHLFLGEADVDSGTVSSAAWQLYGFNLDGLDTTPNSTDVCALTSGAPTVTQLDGVNGIDNGWGAILLPMIDDIEQMAEPSIQQGSMIQKGDWTLQIQVTGLSADPRQSALGLDAQVFVSGSSDGTPAFDSTTDWPVLASSIKDHTAIASGALAHFTNVYVTNGAVVAEASSEPVVVPLRLGFGFFGTGWCPLPPCPDAGTPPISTTQTILPLRIHRPIVTFVRTDTSTVTQGTIAGVLDADELAASLWTLASFYTDKFCGSQFVGIATQIHQAQDILGDYTNRPGVPCNAISIGIGFTAKLISNPTKVAVDPAPPLSQCPPPGRWA